MINKIDRISFSSLQDYKNCPRLFYIKQVLKIPTPKNLFLSFGISCHFICENLLKGKIKKNEVSSIFDLHFLEELKNLDKKFLQDKDFISTLRKQGKNLFPNFLDKLHDHYGDFELVDTEFLLHEPIKEFVTELKFKGFIDTIIKTKKDGKFNIIDWKSCIFWSNEKKNDKKVLYQLIYYKYFYAKKIGIELDDINVEFVLLKRSSKKNNIEFVPITSGGKRISNAMEYLKSACEGIEKENFKREPTYCHFNECFFKGTEWCKNG